jgi:hypothetical protein
MYLILGNFMAIMASIVEAEKCSSGVGVLIVGCFFGLALTLYFILVLVRAEKELVQLYDVKVASKI